MLSPEEIEKIKEQETIRFQLRKELTPEKRRGLWESSAVSSLDKLSRPDPAVTATFQQLPARVYLQIFSEQQRDKAKKIQQILGKQGFIVPGIENVWDKAHPVKETQIRYFNDSDKDVANKVKDILNQNGYANVEALSVPLKVRPKPGTIEVWFAAMD